MSPLLLPDDGRAPSGISEIRYHEGESNGWTFLAFTFVCYEISLLITNWYGSKVSNNSFFYYLFWRINIFSPKATMLWFEAKMKIHPYVAQLEMASREQNMSWPQMRHINQLWLNVRRVNIKLPFSFNWQANSEQFTLGRRETVFRILRELIVAQWTRGWFIHLLLEGWFWNRYVWYMQ